MPAEITIVEKIELYYEDIEGNQLQYYFWENGYSPEVQAKLAMAIKDMESQSVLIGGSPTELYMDADGINHLVWECENPNGTYWIAAPLLREELIRIAESIGVPAL